eukprot:9498978-Pyramimonas_sp.AAC.1
MDISSLRGGKGGKGGSDIACKGCGKMGHVKRGCWLPGGGAHQGTRSQKGKGRSDKGRKAKGKGAEDKSNGGGHRLNPGRGETDGKISSGSRPASEVTARYAGAVVIDGRTAPRIVANSRR